jgi:hypothetical protein
VTLIFFSRCFPGGRQGAVINERSIQPTHHDPPHIRDVKRVLSRSFPPLLWISADARNLFIDGVVRAMSMLARFESRRRQLAAAWTTRAWRRRVRTEIL